MKAILLLAAALLVPAEAQAAGRVASTSLSCAAAKDLIRSEGQAVLHWQSSRIRGLPRYDRFVRDSNFCHENEYAEATTVPTADDPECLVKHCEPRIGQDDDRIIVP